jgi:hypothetical protein
MDIKEHAHPDKLEEYSFLWSEARLLIAAIALLIGGRPPLLLVLPTLYGVLTLAWLMSGVASGYLLYRWNAGGQKLFGGKAPLDTAAFFVSVVSGINLGLAGLIGRNIGISISSNYFVFIVVALLYLASAYHLYTRWNASGKKLF